MHWDSLWEVVPVTDMRVITTRNMKRRFIRKRVMKVIITRNMRQRFIRKKVMKDIREKLFLLPKRPRLQE